ncbi:hybrid sensor histidine kinase/response regulator [Scytonema millei]|uniref:histidine kinase n=1 Tax=Scytonema millei VB511283 TaxID=1245923 RepID=A0A9X5E8X9_9CYAN|nr:hybrid sensor histidine kinase/response regulator [Scytonema millei]NHC37535.1 response regulator [Scytonema millei VB511283]
MLASLVKVLLIEDSLAEARFLQEILRQANLRHFHLVHVKRLGDALAELDRGLISSQPYDAVLLDLTLPDSQGLASLPLILQQAPSLPIVVLTNMNDDELAIEAVRQGAQDYLVKRQIDAKLLVRSLCYAIERKQAAEALQAKNQALATQVQESAVELDKAKQLNRFKSEFVSMLSHDFRSPLTTILLATGLLQNSEKKLTEKQKLTHFHHINAAIKNMAQMLDEVSLAGKAEAGQLQCQPTYLDIQEFCRELIAALELSAAKKQIALVFTCQGQIEKALWDENLLRHILANFLSNAIKYSAAGSSVQFNLIAQPEIVTFQIQDWGIGIPKADLQQLFQPFHRASNVGSTPGTGLGLAIAKKCIEACGGEIYVESEVGVGTTFTVILPVVSGSI